MIRVERRRIKRTLRSYRSILTNERLTASSGIGVLVEIFYKYPLFNELMKHLPECLSHRSLGAGPLALTLMAGHLLGIESVEDLEEMRGDEFFDGVIWRRYDRVSHRMNSFIPKLLYYARLSLSESNGGYLIFFCNELLLSKFIGNF